MPPLYGIALFIGIRALDFCLIVANKLYRCRSLQYFVDLLLRNISYGLKIYR